MRFADISLRWLPLIALVALAIAFEPIRSNFAFANQSCEIFSTANQIAGAFLNAKHIVGYGLICLMALFTLRTIPIWQIAFGVLVFSAMMELLQSFFVTGHCRAWDLIPNVFGVGLAVTLFLTGRVLLRR